MASPSASSLPSLKIMSILLFNMPISKECLWVFGDLQAEGLRGPWYPYQRWEGQHGYEGLSGTDGALSLLPFGPLPSHSASSPSSRPLPFSPSLPGPFCLAVGGTCQPHWARPVNIPAKAPWRCWEASKASSLKNPSCVTIKLPRFSWCLPQGAEQL